VTFIAANSNALIPKLIVPSGPAPLTLNPATALVLGWALNLHVRAPEARYALS